MHLPGANERKINYIFLPLILISLGFIILVINLGNQNLDVWGVILRIWPLFFIYAGIHGLLFRKRGGLNTFFIIFGLALFLSNFGRISWTTWEILFTYWPVLFVAIGTDLVFSQNTIWQLTIAGLVVISIMGALVLVFDSGVLPKPLNEIQIQQPRQDAASGVITLRPSMSNFKLSSQGNTELLIDGTVKLWDGETTSSSYDVQNTEGSYILESSGMFFLYEPGEKNRAEWDIGVTSRIPVGIVIDQEIGEQYVDLSSLLTEIFTSDLLIGQVNIVFPTDRGFEGKINIGIGEIVIDVPEGAAVRIIGKPIIGGVRYPDNYQKTNEYIETIGFAENETQIILYIDQKIGQVIIRQK